MPIRIPPLRGTPPGLIPMRDIGAGANLKSSRYSLPTNQMALLENFYLNEDGSLLGRRGTLIWNAATLGAGDIEGATRAYFATNHFLAAQAGTIYKGDDATKTFASSLTGWNATSPVWFWQYLAFVYASNKINAPQKWDGTAWTPMGIAAPTAAPTVAVGAAGTPNGTYSIKYTYVTATIESNGSPKSADLSVTNQQINVSGVTVGPAGTTKRKIYGFKNAVSSVYQLIGEINNNVDTTFTVTTDQGSWTTAIPTTNDPAPTGPWLTVLFKNRLWKGADPSNPRRLFFSQIFVPEAFPATFYVDIPFSGNDEITALFVLGDLLIVFGHTEVFFVIGETPFNFTIKKAYAVAGCPSPWAVDRGPENTAVYLSRFGVLVFDGSQARPMSDPIEPIFTGLFSSIASLNYAAADKSTLRYYDRLKAMVVSMPTGSSTQNDATWWRFFRRRESGWVKDSRATRLMIVTSGKGDAGELFAFDANDGIMRQWDVNYTDDGVAIAGRWRTGNHAGTEHPLLTKSYGWYTLRARPMSGVAQITAYLDEGVETDTFTLNLSRGAVIGTAVIGTSTLSSELDDFEERFDAVMRGKSVSIEGVLSYSEQPLLAQQYVSYLPMPTVRRTVT